MPGVLTLTYKNTGAVRTAGEAALSLGKVDLPDPGVTDLYSRCICRILYLDSPSNRPARCAGLHRVHHLLSAAGNGSIVR